MTESATERPSRAPSDAQGPAAAPRHPGAAESVPWAHTGRSWVIVAPEYAKIWLPRGEHPLHSPDMSAPNP